MFKQKQTAPAPALSPARQSLTAHLAKMSTLDAQRRMLNERAGALVADIERADACAREVQALSETIDAKAVAAVVNGTVPIDLTAERAALAELQRKAAYLNARAETARKARAELAAQSEALLIERKPLPFALTRLCHDAISEDMCAMADELREAEHAYRSVLRRVFLRATACDLLRAQNPHAGFPLLDALRYTQHVPQLPRVEAFDAVGPNKFDVQRDFEALQTEAEALIGRLLRGEDHGA